MRQLTDAEVRGALRNCTRGERQRANLPDLSTVDWAALAYLGWRDPRAPQVGYLVQDRGNEAVGLVLRAPLTPVRRRAQCVLCQVVHDDNIALFSARRPGGARTGHQSLGTYVCADLDCSGHLRRALRPSRELPDPAPLLQARLDALGSRLTAFVDGVLSQDVDD